MAEWLHLEARDGSGVRLWRNKAQMKGFGEDAWIITPVGTKKPDVDVDEFDAAKKCLVTNPEKVRCRAEMHTMPEQIAALTARAEAAEKRAAAAEAAAVALAPRVKSLEQDAVRVKV